LHGNWLDEHLTDLVSKRIQIGTNFVSRLRPEDAKRRKREGFGPDFLEAFARGLRVIEAFSREKQVLTISDAARATELPKPSVRRALYTLSRLGYAEETDRGFRLKPKVLSLASAFLGSNTVAAVLQPACKRVSERTNQSCFGAILDGDDIVIVAHASVENPAVVESSIGLRRPAFCTAAGRAILSRFSDDELDTWIKKLKPTARTPFTITDRRQLRKEILHVRKQGFSVTEQELRQGRHALAVPLTGHDGRPVASLCVTSWIDDVEHNLTRQYLPIIREEAASAKTSIF
jgi:IclR family pca regulon transcriptional regulator